MKDHIEHRVKSKVEKYVKKGFKILFFIIAAIAFVLLIGFIIMKLWNWLMPDILGLVTITYWQAVGLLILAKILFGSFGDHDSKKREKKSRGPKRKWTCNPEKSDFTQWEHYDEFWKEEGEGAYKSYVERLNKKNE